MNVDMFPIAKSEIFHLLEENEIMVNEYCKTYIEHERFRFSDTVGTRKIIILTLEEMDFTEPACIPEIENKAKELDYKLCEPSMGVYLRLHYTHQMNSNNTILSGQQRSPNGAVQIASAPLESDYDFPRGLYIRKVDHKLWLRGFICDDEHLFTIENQFAFEPGNQ